MNYPNILFKVISNDIKNQSMVIKFCLSASDKPIDEYKAYNISYWNLDFTSTGALIDSIRNQGLISIVNELSQEPTIPEHQDAYYEEDFSSVNLDDFVDKLVSTSSDSTSDLNQIEL
jgi:hypothetical protein|tara:strand:+ start:19 stop:369 length:351 start_codon:yes stop_codon:yes gene_type:complete